MVCHKILVFESKPADQSQYESWKYFDPSSQSSFDVVFLGPTANAELPVEFHIALHVCYAAVPALTSSFPPEHNPPPPKVINYFLTFNETQNTAQVLNNFLLLHTQTVQFPQHYLLHSPTFYIVKYENDQQDANV
jgi:hypothetical protein